MANNITIKDGGNNNVVLHTIEDASNVHFNQSIPTDTANNTATVVSGGQAVAAGMGALVVAQRDALPSGTNHLGKVSIVGSVSIQQTSGLFVQAQGMYMATPPTLVDATVSTLQTDSRGSLRVTLVSPDSNGGIGKTSSFTDANVNNQNRLTTESYPMVFNRASSTWDRLTGTSVGLAVTQAGTWNVGLNAGTNLVGAVSISPNGLNIPVSIANVPNVNIAGAIVSNTGTSLITFSNSALYTVGFNYGWDGSNWRRVESDTSGRLTALNKAVYNTTVPTHADATVSVVQMGLRGALHTQIQGGDSTITWAFGADNADGVAAVGAGIPKIGSHTKVWNTAGSTWDRWDGKVSIGNTTVPVSISPNGLNIPVSVASTGAPSLDGNALGTTSNLRVMNANYVYTKISDTWDRMAGTSVGIYVQGNASAGATNLGRMLPVGGTDGTNNRTLLTTTGGALVVHISNALPAAGASMLQTVGAAVTTEGYPMLGSDGSLARRLLTTTGGALVVHVSNAQPTPSGISMLQTVGAAVTTEGYPMLGSDGTNARRLLTTTGGALVVHVSNSAPGGGAGGSTQLVSIGGAVSTQAVQIAGTDGANNARTFLTDTTGRLAIASIGQKVVVSVNGGQIVGQNNLDGQGTQQGLFVHNQGSVFNRNSNTWDRMTGTSAGLAVIQGGTWTVSVSDKVSVAGLVGLNAGANLVGAVSISPNGLNIPVSAASAGFPNGDGQGLQTAHALRVMNANYVYTKISDTWDRLAGTSVGLYVQGNASAGATNLGRSMIVGGTDGTNNRTLLTTTGGALVVHVSNTAPGGAVGGGSMTHTVGAAVTTEGYPMLGSDGTLSRRLLTTTGGALIVHVSNTAPGGGAGGSTMTQTVGAAVTTQGYPMLGTDGTNARGLLTTTGGALVVHISNALPAAGASMLQTVGAAVTNQGYPMLGTDGTNARGLLTTTGGALIVHVSNSAPGAGGGGGSTQLVSVGGAVSTQGVQIVGKDPNSNARTLKTNVSGALYITTRTFLSQDVFTRPADTTAYAAGATAAPGNAGDLIANSTTNTAVKPLKFRIAKGPGQVAYIRGARMFRTGGTLATGQHNITGAIRLHLFNTANKVSVANGDNGALNASPVSNWMGYIDLVAIACAPGLRTSGAVSTQVYWGSPARTGEMIVDLSAAQVSIQGLLETRIAFTPISGEIFTVQIEGFNG